MSTLMTKTPGDSQERSIREESALHAEAIQVAARREQYHGRVRLAYIAAGVVAAIVIVGILLVTLLPTFAPSAPTTLTMPASTIGTAADKVGNPITTAPSILTSTYVMPSHSTTGMGSLTASQDAVLNLPRMSNDLGFWDRIQPAPYIMPTHSTTGMGNLSATQDAVLNLPRMSNDLGFWDRIQIPAQSLPSWLTPNGVGVFSFDRVQTRSITLPPYLTPQGMSVSATPPSSSPGDRPHVVVGAH